MSLSFSLSRWAVEGKEKDLPKLSTECHFSLKREAHKYRNNDARFSSITRCTIIFILILNFIIIIIIIIIIIHLSSRSHSKGNSTS